MQSGQVHQRNRIAARRSLQSLVPTSSGCGGFSSGACDVRPGPRLPINGEPIYARLFTQLNGTWVHTDYTYTATIEAQATLTTRTPGSTLTGSAVTFTWTSAPSATEYILALGAARAGSSNLYYSGATTATSATVATLPTNGQTIYARLFTQLNGTCVHIDDTYTAAL